MVKVENLPKVQQIGGRKVACTTLEALMDAAKALFAVLSWQNLQKTKFKNAGQRPTNFIEFRGEAE